jgi:hypothetical protein
MAAQPVIVWFETDPLVIGRCGVREGERCGSVVSERTTAVRVLGAGAAG